MKTTMTLSTNLNCNPFEIFNQEVDEVIMIINFYLELSENEEENKPSASKDDGFWDM